MQIEYRPIGESKPYPGNPRVNADAVPAVAASIREFGFRNPILLDADGIIVAGHTRLAAAQSLGLAEVPVVFITDLSPDQIRALRLADNQTASLSTWQEELLFREIEGLRAAEVDLSTLGFSDAELTRILAPSGTEGHTDPDAVPAAGNAPVSETGAVYALGRHRVVCAEGLSPDEAMGRLMAGERADMVLADVAVADGAADGLAGVVMATDAALAPGGSFYLWHTDDDTAPLRTSCLATGWEIRQGLVWENGSPTPAATDDYVRCHDNCLYGWKAGAPHQWFSDRCQTTVLAPEGVAGGTGPSPDKPVGLLAYLVGNSCPPGGMLLDPFGGVGAVAIVAERTGRQARIMTASRSRCDVIRRRWAEFVHGPGCDWQAATPAAS